MRRFSALLCVLAGCASTHPVERTLAEHSEELTVERRFAGDLKLDCSPKDAEVLLDGVLQGTCEDFADQLLRLDEADHVVEVGKIGFQPYRIVVQAGRTRTALKAQLAPMP